MHEIKQFIHSMGVRIGSYMKQKCILWVPFCVTHVKKTFSDLNILCYEEAQICPICEKACTDVLIVKKHVLVSYLWKGMYWWKCLKWSMNRHNGLRPYACMLVKLVETAITHCHINVTYVRNVSQSKVFWMITSGSMVEKNWTAGIFVAALILTWGTGLRGVVLTTQRKDVKWN